MGPKHKEGKSQRRLVHDAQRQIDRTLQPLLEERHIALLTSNKLRRPTAKSDSFTRVVPTISKYAEAYALQDQIAEILKADFTNKKLNKLKKDGLCWSEEIHRYGQHAKRFVNDKLNTMDLNKGEDEEDVMGSITPAFENPHDKVKPVRKVAKIAQKLVLSPPPPKSPSEAGQAQLNPDDSDDESGGGSNVSVESNGSGGSGGSDHEESEDGREPARKKVKVAGPGLGEDTEDGAKEVEDKGWLFYA